MILFGSKGSTNKTPILRILICLLKKMLMSLRDLEKFLVSVLSHQEEPPHVYTSPDG